MHMMHLSQYIAKAVLIIIILPAVNCYTIFKISGDDICIYKNISLKQNMFSQAHSALIRTSDVSRQTHRPKKTR